MNKYQKALTNLCIEYEGKYVVQFKKGVNRDDYKLLQELVERATPMRPNYIHLINRKRKLYAGSCAICKQYVSQEHEGMGINEMQFCPSCGQKLKWSDDE